MQLTNNKKRHMLFYGAKHHSTLLGLLFITRYGTGNQDYHTFDFMIKNSLSSQEEPKEKQNFIKCFAIVTQT